MNLINRFGARSFSIRGIHLPIVLSIKYKLKESTLYLKSGENNTIYLFFIQYGAPNCVLEKLLVFPAFETVIITPCRIYGKYDYAKCYY